MSVIGKTWCGLAERTLNTGFLNFVSDTGIEGLCKIEGSTLVLLAIFSPDPGKGNFRRFMANAKNEFAEIVVIDIMNPELAKTLARYDFKTSDYLLGDDPGDVMRWRKDQAKCNSNLAPDN